MALCTLGTGIGACFSRNPSSKFVGFTWVHEVASKARDTRIQASEWRGFHEVGQRHQRCDWGLAECSVRVPAVGLCHSCSCPSTGFRGRSRCRCSWPECSPCSHQNCCESCWSQNGRSEAKGRAKEIGGSQAGAAKQSWGQRLYRVASKLYSFVGMTPDAKLFEKLPCCEAEYFEKLPWQHCSTHSPSLWRNQFPNLRDKNDSRVAMPVFWIGKYKWFDEKTATSGATLEGVSYLVDNQDARTVANLPLRTWV